MEPLNDTHLARFLRTGSVAGRLIYPGRPTPTVRAAAEVLGVEPGRILKSLVFLADGRPWLAVATGLAHLDPHLLAEAFGVARRRVRLAAATEAFEITGYQVGAMPPFGHRRRLPTVVDESIVAGKVYYGGGGSGSVMLELGAETLIAVTGAQQVPLTKEKAYDS